MCKYIDGYIVHNKSLHALFFGFKGITFQLVMETVYIEYDSHSIFPQNNLVSDDSRRWKLSGLKPCWQNIMQRGGKVAGDF